MDAHLRAGIAIYNAGGYHDAHDAWEDRWLDLEAGTDDERFLHGLIQFTAAVHHGYQGNWKGLSGLAGSARAYLAGLPADYRGVNLGEIRAYLAALDRDPEHVEREAPPPLRHQGEALSFSGLEFEATAVVAEVLAETVSEYDEGVIEDAVRYAGEGIDAGEHSPFVTFVMDFVRDDEKRETVYARLKDRVERRRSREEDVEGLFDPE